MSNLIPTIATINGQGKPRLLCIKEEALYFSGTGTVYSSTGITVSEDVGAGAILAGMRVSSYVIAAGLPDKLTWGKVKSVDAGASSTIVVDGWSQGTPSNAQPFTVDGFVMDLPYCYELEEKFTPDLLLHELWAQERGTKIETEFHGWEYQCSLDYSRWIAAETILTLQPALSMGANDQLVLIPHADQPGFNYRVFYAGPVSISKYGLAKGYKKPVFVFRCNENLASWPLIDGYGMHYGENYGYYL
jgi:hypothetical protein